MCLQQESIAPCDPRCKQHRGKSVSQRIRRDCTKRIELSLAFDAALPHSETIDTSSPASISMAKPRRSLNLQQRALASLIPAQPPQPPLTLDEDDPTMSTWDLPFDDDLVEYGAREDESTAGSDDEPPIIGSYEVDAESDYETDTRSASPSREVDVDLGSTDVGYTSGSEADVELDGEKYMDLDNLLPISPNTSHPGSPSMDRGAEVAGDLEDLVSILHGTAISAH